MIKNLFLKTMQFKFQHMASRLVWEISQEQDGIFLFSEWLLSKKKKKKSPQHPKICSSWYASVTVASYWPSSLLLHPARTPGCQRMSRGQELHVHLSQIIPSGSVLLPALDALAFWKVRKIRLYFAAQHSNFC